MLCIFYICTCVYICIFDLYCHIYTYIVSYSACGCTILFSLWLRLPLYMQIRRRINRLIHLTDVPFLDYSQYQLKNAIMNLGTTPSHPSMIQMLEVFFPLSGTHIFRNITSFLILFPSYKQPLYVGIEIESVDRSHELISLLTCMFTMYLPQPLFKT